jgi:hypothetical protein
MQINSSSQPAGNVRFKVIKRKRVPTRHLSLWEILKYGLPHFGVRREIFMWRLRNMRHFLRGLFPVVVARLFRIQHLYGQLNLSVYRANGEVLELGIASLRVVTDVGVGYIVDAFQNTVEPENMKFHGFGTGTNAENQTNTALQTELTTQYAGDVRPTGSTTEAAANIYQTVATLSPDSGGTIAVTEHGVFSANSAGVLLDRSVFSAVNIVAGSDSLQADYRLTFPANG